MNVGDISLVVAASAAIISASVDVAKDTIAKALPPTIEGTAVMPAVVRPGESVLVEWTVTKREACPGEAARAWTGHGSFSLTEEMRPSTLPATGKPAVYRIETTVPVLIPPGAGVLEIHGYFDCKGREREWFKLGPVNFEVTE